MTIVSGCGTSGGMRDQGRGLVIISEKVNGFGRLNEIEMKQALSGNTDHPVFRVFWQVLNEGLAQANSETRAREMSEGARAHACGAAEALDDLLDRVAGLAMLKVEDDEG